MKFGVVGAGGWGTAIARLLARAGHQAVLWTRDPHQADCLEEAHENRKYLPGVRLPEAGLEITSRLDLALDTDAVLLAVPSFGMSDLLSRMTAIGERCPILINLAKGIDRTTHRTMSELIESMIPSAHAFTLSGPSHAEEVGRDIPTAVVLAGKDMKLGRLLQEAMATDRFRIYLSEDIRGVELCAAVKNIIALATGISDGLGYGDNSRGALITRGLAEMVRFGRSFGAREATFFGLSGLGDLVATCTSTHSRNRYVGVQLGQGVPLKTILSTMSMVAEGVFATHVVYDMACSSGLDMPITQAVHELLLGTADPLSLVDRIMTRAPKMEGQ